MLGRTVTPPTPSVLVMGGSVSAGGGVGNDPNQAWHAFLGGNVKPTVHFKGAIDPSYFLHCTNRFVDHKAYDVALFDLGANMFDSYSQEYLVELVARVRCLTNVSSVGIINWPGFIMTNDTAVAARRARATLIEIPHGPELYHTDKVHPNVKGHARIAERVRSYMSRLPRDGVAAADCTANRAETCYPNALDMPVVRVGDVAPHGWKLVDDSPTPERMHKYGWASSTPGTNLTLIIPQDDLCGAVVTLAYLASKDTGPFRLTCSPGCACTKLRAYHQPRTHPFPVVTGREDCAGTAFRCDGLKVTRDTSFLVLRDSEKLCRVTVTALSSRRVRIDGLYVQEPSTPLVRYARFTPPSTAAQRWFGTHAHDTTCKGTA